MPYKSIHTKNVNVLRKWAKNNHSITTVLDTGQQDRYLLSERIIVINDGQSDENKCYSLLHELGHLMNRSKREKQFCKKYDLLHKAEATGETPRTYAYRIQVIEEEIGAWRNGQALAERLNLKIDFDRYNNYASRCVMSYVDWAAERDWKDHV